ncbi:MAG: ABC transporter permease [Ignavibacteriae bacterium]|nr:ABC transporter permease [Ignavibacteriota bacterium]
MRYEHLIATRYVRSKRQMRFINIIMLVSVVGITVGVAALIIVLSIFNGFNSVVTQVLVGFDPHIRIEPAKGKSIQMSDGMMSVLSSDKRIAAWSPFIQSKAMLVTSRVNRVVYVKGVVDSTIGLVSGVRKSTILGEFGLNANSVVLGLALADRLGATVSTELTVVSPVGVDAMILQFGQPIMRKFSVTGIYDSNNKDYDAHYAYVSLAAAQQLFQYGNGVSGLEIRLHDMEHSESVKEYLQKIFGNRYNVQTWYDLHKDLYSVMRLERWAAYIILCLIVGVATFNVLGSLTMGVIEKKRDIGILKALGSTKSSITRVFMFEGILVGTIGTIVGTLIGLLVCYLQIEHQLFPLDPNVYIIPAIPVEIRWSDFVAVSLASMVLSTLASLYPGLRASSLMPVDAIRWE